ncbi:MAG: phosphate acyltransferase [Verrucomicrobiales bacterium]
MSKDLFSEPNHFTAPLFEKLQRHPKRIVFTDGEDARVVRVAGRMIEMGLGIPILLGSRERIRAMVAEEGIKDDFLRIIEPGRSSDLDLFVERFERIEKYRGMPMVYDAKGTISKPMNFGAMMIQYGQADALVGGNVSTPAAVFRSLLHFVKPLPQVPKVFGVTILSAEHLSHFGRDGLLFFADSGLIPHPNISEIASFAVHTGNLARHYLGRRPRVAMLSHSTLGTGGSDPAELMQAATEQARAVSSPLELEIDGELQADVALDPEAAEVKIPGQERKEPADVLIFPNLDAAHISMKLLQHTAGARNYGQLVMGLARPAAQVPRTADEETILGTAAAVGVEAIKFHELYPDGEV